MAGASARVWLVALAVLAHGCALDTDGRQGRREDGGVDVMDASEPVDVGPPRTDRGPPLDVGPSCVPALETCNGRDDDCDGARDEDFACTQLETGFPCTTPCGTPGSGVCSDACALTCTSVTEVCGNACDDDGNGVADDGCGPSNDGCAGAIELSGRTGAIRATLAGATAQVLGCGTGVDVFYFLDVAQPSFVYVDTFGSALDTRLSYLGTDCLAATPVFPCPDDACGTRQTRIVAFARAAGRHFFAVHTSTAADAPGPFALTYQVLPLPSGTVTELTRTGSLTGATSGRGSVSLVCADVGDDTAPEDAYFWLECPGAMHTVEANTCDRATGFDTTLQGFGPSLAGVCVDDSSCGDSGNRTRISLTADARGLWVIYVDGWNGASGAYTFSVTRF